MAKSQLDSLLDDIHPSRLSEKYGKWADDALNSFGMEAAQIEDWDRFRHFLIKFHHHVESRILQLSLPYHGGTDFEWGRCVQVLMRAFGKNGDHAAFEMARTGNEGGLYAVLRKMAEVMAGHYGQNAVEARISIYWSSLSVAEQFAAIDEYLAKYGYLLPSELTENGAMRIKCNFIKVLEEHPKIIQRLREIGRR